MKNSGIAVGPLGSTTARAASRESTNVPRGFSGIYDYWVLDSFFLNINNI